MYLKIFGDRKISHKSLKTGQHVVSYSRRKDGPR